MLVKIQNPLVFTKAIELISELVSEVRLRVNEYGMSITAMDPANVSMVNMRIPKSAFSYFEVGNETLGVSLENLKRILKRAGTGSSVTIEKKDGLLNITIEDRIKRSFSMALINIDSEEIDFISKISNMEFSSKVEIASLDMVSSIEDCSVVADACYFLKTDGKFIIEAKGLNSAKSEFSGDEAKIQGEDSKAKYSLEYLAKFMKGAKICDTTRLEFANDHPLKLEFKNPQIELSFVLAPRVETED